MKTSEAEGKIKLYQARNILAFYSIPSFSGSENYFVSSGYFCFTQIKNVSNKQRIKEKIQHIHVLIVKISFL